MNDAIEKKIADALWELSLTAKEVRHDLQTIKEIIMSTVPPGLAALQTFVTAFQAFATQQSTDLASLTTNITAAITALQSSGASEDPQVQSAVNSLTAALSNVQSNETALETLNTNLASAENPTGEQAQSAAKKN